MGTREPLAGAVIAFGVASLLVLSLILAAPPAAGADPASEPCASCRVAVHTNGWCDRHAVGYVAAVPIRSTLLYEMMDAHGHELDLSNLTCPTCRKAADTDGYCELDRIGFARRMAYFSYLTWAHAMGEPRIPEEITCPVCRRHAARRGWCDTCKVGMLGPVAIRDKTLWQRAARAAEILEDAARASTRCEYCATAMVTDTQCPLCRITYKDGKPLPPSPKP